jgi:hypothetical protein
VNIAVAAPQEPGPPDIGTIAGCQAFFFNALQLGIDLSLAAQNATPQHLSRSNFVVLFRFERTNMSKKPLTWVMLLSP